QVCGASARAESLRPLHIRESRPAAGPGRTTAETRSETGRARRSQWRARSPQHLDRAGPADLRVARDQGQLHRLSRGANERVERVASESKLVGAEHVLAGHIERLVGRVAE